MTNAGYVGVGTVTPPALLTVGSGNLFQVNLSGIVRSVFGSASTPTYSFTGSTNTGMFSSAAGILNFSTAGSEKMRVDGSGNVAIGASTISGIKFYIYGGLSRFYNYSYPSGDALNFELYPPSNPRIYSPTNKVVFYNTPGGDWIDIEAKHFLTGSDASLKTNIITLTNSLNKVLQLRGVSFNWINDSLNSKVNTGFIAQEVEPIIPEVIFTNDSNNIKMLSYTGIIPFLVEAIKEQQLTIDSQTIALKAQDTRINTLETDLAKCCNVPANKSLQLPNGSNNNENGSAPALYQNIPNPFNTKTIIGYYLPNETANASLLVFDMQGKLIKTYKISTFGKANIEINASELQPGMYMYSLIANGKEVDTKKMILTE